MTRVNIIVEGHSEEQFVRDILGEYLAPRAIYVCRVKTGRKSGKDYRGGVTTYAKILFLTYIAYLMIFLSLKRLRKSQNLCKGLIV